MRHIFSVKRSVQFFKKVVPHTSPTCFFFLLFRDIYVLIKRNKQTGRTGRSSSLGFGGVFMLLNPFRFVFNGFECQELFQGRVRSLRNNFILIKMQRRKHRRRVDAVTTATGIRKGKHMLGSTPINIYTKKKTHFFFFWEDITS